MKELFFNKKKLNGELDYVLENVSGLCKDLEFKHPLEIYRLFSFMLKKGHLSVNHKYKYYGGEKYSYEINNLLGLNVFTGKSCCRHNAELLYDLYSKLGIDSHQLYVKTIDVDNKDDIIRNLGMDFSDHVINLVGDSSYYYFLESTKFDVSNYVVDDLIISTKHASVDYIVDDVSLMHMLGKKGVISKDDIRYKVLVERIPASFSEIKDITSRSKRVIKNNVDLLEKCYDLNKGVYQEVSNILVKK